MVEETSGSQGSAGGRSMRDDLRNPFKHEGVGQSCLGHSEDPESIRGYRARQTSKLVDTVYHPQVKGPGVGQGYILRTECLLPLKVREAAVAAGAGEESGVCSDNESEERIN